MRKRIPQNLGDVGACACSRYQAFLPEGLGTRLRLGCINWFVSPHVVTTHNIVIVSEFDHRAGAIIVVSYTTGHAISYTVEPPNKGHFGIRACPLYGGCPLVGGSTQFVIYSHIKHYKIPNKHVFVKLQ